MRHIAQNTNECLLTAICQVVPSLNIIEERKYYLDKGEVTNSSLFHWAKTRFPEVYPAICKFRDKDGEAIKGRLNLAKKGILLIRFGAGIWSLGHVISYEKSMVLDSAYIGKKESIKAFKVRYTGWHIEAVIPIDRE